MVDCSYLMSSRETRQHLNGLFVVRCRGAGTTAGDPSVVFQAKHSGSERARTIEIERDP